MPRRSLVGEASGRGGRGAAERGRISKPECARPLPFTISASGNAEDVEPTPGPSVEKSRPYNLAEEIKAYKVAKALDAKNVAKLSPAHKKRLEELRQLKQVGNFKMPDASEPKLKGKGKGKKTKEGTRVWGPCPLLPGVPIVPPAYIPQPWQQRRHDKDVVIEGTAADLKIPQPSAGTPPRTAPESVMDFTEMEEDNIIEGTPPDIIIPQRFFAKTATESVIDITDEMCPPHHIIPGHTAELETIPPAKTPPRKRNRIIQFPPSTGIIQVDSTVSPLNIVPAEIEFLGFTPSSTTSTVVPGSGRSAYDLDVQLDIEPGEGSDIEHEEDLVFKPRHVHENPMDCNLADPVLATAIRSLDFEADSALRTVLDPGTDQDLLSFDWRCEPEHFEGVREVFTVPSPGPTFEHMDLTPSEIFFKIWDADLIALIVRETNRYGAEMVGRNQKPNSRLQRWKNVTEDEIKLFFAIIMLQSLVVNNVEHEYWYPQFEELQIGNFKHIMPYNRFVAIKRCLHFVDNASLPEHPNKLDKIMPILERLNDKFSSLYVLEQNVAINESLLLWKGRLSFSQKIATKKARVGIKSYELCESRTGYLWRMEIYSGKGHVHVAQVGSQEPVEEGTELGNASSQIVLTLMRPLFNRGHTVIMDNFYNAPLLSRILKVKHKTDSMGTLRLNREFVPEGLKKKAKQNMKAGEMAFSSTKDLSVLVWMDKNIVSMISTFHEIKIGGIEKYGYYKYKPQVVLDYNLSMGGIDHKDQMLHAYPIERVRNIIWYKKLFRRLINVSIHNSFVLFNHKRTKVFGNREFRLQLVKELLQRSRPKVLPRSLVPVAPVAPSQMHLPAKNERPQRCKLCAGAKVRRTTVWRCSTCAVNLCIEGCYTAYHNKL